MTTAPSAAVAVAPAAAPRRFVILGMQRTGTTLLDTLLRSHPDVDCRGEVFLAAARRFPALQRIKVKHRHFYRNVLARSPLDQLRHALPSLRPALLRRYLEDLCVGLGVSTDVCAVGFRLMLNQVPSLPGVLEWLGEQRVQVVRMRRRNLLKTLVSREVHRLRGRSQMRVQESVPRVRLDTALLPMRLAELAAEDDGVAALLPGHPTLEVSYEDLCTDRDATFARVLEHLGVRTDVVASTKLLKITSDDLSQALDNYPDVAAALGGGPWAWCLAGDAPPR